MGKIVVVEDNQDMRENIVEILTLAGYEVEEAENGREGVRLIKEVIPDLILCDVMMPELDGYGVLHMVTNHASTAHIPFIFLTAKSEKGDFRKGMNLGADDYLVKPFEELDLLEAIEVRLKKHKDYRGIAEVQAFLTDAGQKLDLEKIARDGDLISVNKKEVIYHIGNHPKELFFIESGKVKTEMLNEDGKIFVNDVFGPGEFIGYTALIQDTVYMDSAVALEASRLFAIPRTDFLTLLFSEKQISEHFIKLLANNIEGMEVRLRDMAYNSVRKRVADGLLYLEKKFASEALEAFSIQILREDLASLVGMAKETLIRTLSDLKTENLIKIESGKITILNKEKLANIIA